MTQNQREVEQTRRDSDARMRAVFEAAVDAIITIDEQGTVESLNPAAQRLFSYAATEIVGRNVSALMPSPYHEEHDSYLANYRRTGERKIIGIGREVVGRRQDGTTFPMDLAVSEVLLGDRRLFTGIVRDISERKRAEQALRDSETRTRAILEAAVDAIITIDEKGLVESLNPAAERIFGYAAEEVIGQNVSTLMPSPYHEEHDSYLANYRRTGERKIIGIGREVIGRRQDGTTFPMDLAVSEVLLGDRRLFTGIVRDISERKTLEAQILQAQKMETVGRLAGGIAHDFNNLLTALIGHVELALADPDLKGTARADVGDARATAGRAADLTQQLLAFSRQQIIEPIVINLNDLLSQTDRMLGRLIGEDVKLTLDLGDGVPAVKVDPGRFEQVLVNLAVNARDAMPDGGELRLETRAAAFAAPAVLGEEIPAGSYAMLVVSDTGLGMSDDVKQRMFEPFFTTKPTGVGSGLGLATSYGIIKQAGGHIWVSSEPGSGTVFKVYLPAASELSAVASTTAPTNGGHGGSETILVVEDDPDVRRLTARVLRGLGYAVLEADNGNAALRIVRESLPGPDLVLTDIVMPQMGGKALVDELRAMQVRSRVLFTSGYTDDAIVRRGVLEHEISFLQKPFTPDQLARKVREVLDNAN